MALRRYVYLFEESKELVRMKREEKQKRTPGHQKPSSENRTLDVHVDDSELIACLEEVEGKAGKAPELDSLALLLAGKKRFLKLTISGYQRPSFMLGSEVPNLISAVYQSYGTIHPSQLNILAVPTAIRRLIVRVREFLTNWTMQQGPAFLISKYACDLKIVRLLRQRGLGNSSSAVMKQVREQHGESYLNNLQMHLPHCRDFKTSAERGLFAPIQFSEPPPAAAVPTHCWLMKVYQIDVLNRVDYIKAHMTSQSQTLKEVYEILTTCIM
uniref:DUF6729 domain-containing protein n=1 Tax=Magallana gigas TaxID=29159 RepID=A0A8W8NVU4_MAGGI